MAKIEFTNQENQFIAEIKERVRKAQYEALKVVNTELISLYWDLGRAISEKQKQGWGKSIVPKLSKELQKEFPGVSGLSEGNLWLMAQFYNEYQLDVNLVPLVREISWSKHIAILKKCKEPQERLFYTQATKKFGWTKDILTNQIENNTFERYLLNQTNWESTLPDVTKKNATLAIKDHYTFEFLNLADEHGEAELEQALDLVENFCNIPERYRCRNGNLS